jgi:hypothetical protein
MEFILDFGRLQVTVTPLWRKAGLDRVSFENPKTGHEDIYFRETVFGFACLNLEELSHEIDRMPRRIKQRVQKIYFRIFPQNDWPNGKHFYWSIIVSALAVKFQLATLRVEISLHYGFHNIFDQRSLGDHNHGLEWILDPLKSCNILEHVSLTAYVYHVESSGEMRDQSRETKWEELVDIPKRRHEDEGFLYQLRVVHTE